MTEMISETQDCKLTDLPPEIFEPIVELLSHDGIQHDLISLSSTNRALRALLASRIFHSVVLGNNERSGAALGRIADGQYARCVKELHYKGIVPIPGAKVGPWKICPPGPIPFPESVQSMLSHLERLPCLQKIVMDFPFKNWDDFMDIEDAPDHETEEEVRKAENENGWRALIRQSFDALVRNDRSAPRHLEIRQLTHFAVSTFETPVFQHLLGLLTGFSLSLRGWSNGNGGGLSALPSAWDFANQLGPWFFNHLGNVESLVFETSNAAPIGLDHEPSYLPLRFKTNHMPFLRFLKVRYLFICAELSNFIAAHAHVLEEIAMVDCMASLLPAEGIAWSIFFDIIADARPSKLRKLDVTWTGGLVWAWPWERKAENETVEQMLRDDPEAIVFNYANLDEVDGFLHQEDREMKASFFEGTDQQAYQRLMGIVRKNRADHSGGGGNSGKPVEQK